MKITVTTLTDDIFILEVRDDMELENVKALCELECHIPAREINLLWNGQPLHDDKKKLKEYGVHDGDMLLLQRVQGAMGQGSVGFFNPGQAAPSTSGGTPMIDFGSIEMPGTSDGGGSRPARGGGGGGGRAADDPAAIRDMLLNSPHELSILKERNPPLAEALLSGNLGMGAVFITLMIISYYS